MEGSRGHFSLLWNFSNLGSYRLTVSDSSGLGEFCQEVWMVGTAHKSWSSEADGHSNPMPRIPFLFFALCLHTGHTRDWKQSIQVSFFFASWLISWFLTYQKSHLVDVVRQNWHLQMFISDSVILNNYEYSFINSTFIPSRKEMWLYRILAYFNKRTK